MRKRYTEEEIFLIEKLVRQGVSCKEVADIIGVTTSAIQHVISRRNIRFCKNPYIPIDGEVWKNCLGIPDIMVSNMGRFLRISSNSIIKSYSVTQGYQAVDFNGQSYNAHRLVAMVFIPNPENKPEVNHIDGNKVNNCVSNLEWVYPFENVRHAYRTGLIPIRTGQDHHRTSLTSEEIVNCVKLRDEGMTYPEIANIYGVYWKTVSRHVNIYRRSTERSETIPQGSRE